MHSCNLRLGCNNRKNYLASTGGIRYFYELQIRKQFLFFGFNDLNVLFSHCCSPASTKPTCKPWSEPWSEASVVVLPHWFVALVRSSLVLVTLTSLQTDQIIFPHTAKF